MIWFANKEFHAKKKPGLVLHEIKKGGLINPSGFEKITNDFGHTFWKLISPDPSYKCLGTAVTPNGIEPSKIRYCCVYEKYLDQNHQISKAASTWKLGYQNSSKVKIKKVLGAQFFIVHENKTS